MSRRWHAVPPRPALSDPASVNVERCYAMTAGRHRWPITLERVEFLLIDAERHVRWLPGRGMTMGWEIAGFKPGERICGWRPLSRQFTYADPDLVDPQLAPLDAFIDIAASNAEAGHFVSYRRS